MRTPRVICALLALGLFISGSARGNGGPFVIQYPEGDPSAKGVLGRLDPSLKPARETRLRVIREDLRVSFTPSQPWAALMIDRPVRTATPLAHVEAEYTIENPTAEDIQVDFGFPILRGIYISPLSMAPAPSVQVQLDGQGVRCTVISNSVIYGIIRQQARATIEGAVARDTDLQERLLKVRQAAGPVLMAARQSLGDYLVETRQWSPADASLMVEYACIELGEEKVVPFDRGPSFWAGPGELYPIMQANLGPLSAIGEQKATQFLARLAGLFDAEAAAGYEDIFKAWGGDVRELALDMKSGTLRPREIEAPELAEDGWPVYRPNVAFDPTVYARVDYLNEKAPISEDEKASCRAILKNLPVIFTFAPMNILHYQATFPAGTTRTLTVTYDQHPYKDTKDRPSFQLAYVLHPASLWDDFGPIHLTVKAPRGVKVRGSTPLLRSSILEDTPYGPAATLSAVVRDKTGELYLAVDGQDWTRWSVQATEAAQALPTTPPAAPLATGVAP